MQYKSSLAALAAILTTAQAAYQGFNYGSTFSDGTIKAQGDFENDFNSAKNLAGTNGAFTSARLYTMVQGGTTNTPISAIQAAIDTQTTLLLGMWASAGAAGFNNELAALSSAISIYGTAFTDLVAGISVGSEDLYRVTAIAASNGNTDPGADPETLISYISQVRSVIAGTTLSAAPVGHVDTWTAYDNSSNSGVIGACDFLGMDAYPYYENTKDNSIGNANATFYSALDTTISVSQGKPVWVTETGWPVSGPQDGNAITGTANAQAYWDAVGCSTFGVVNMWWFTLQDAQPDLPSPSFGLVGAGNPPPTTPMYDLTC